MKLADSLITLDAFQDRLNNFFSWDLDASLFSSLMVMLVLLILGIIVGVKARRAYKRKDYLKRPRGILFFAEWYYEYVDGFVTNNMGEDLRIWGGYFFTLFAYLLVAFIWGLTGLPSIIDWLAAPLCLSLIMLVLIHKTAIKYQHWGYFKRYIDPIPVFLPANLITMWSPLISTCMRMFGNCLSGTIVIGLLQWALSGLSESILAGWGVSGVIYGVSDTWWSFWNGDTMWTSIWLAPIPIGVLQLYFSLFSGVIQTLVFCSLSALWIAQERPLPESPAVSDAPRQTLEVLAAEGPAE